MFTGLVQAIGTVAAAETARAGRRLLVAPVRDWRHRPETGESISVSGCCLTVAEVSPDGVLAFDVVPETMSKSTLGALQTGSRVNLEASVTPSTLLGGHLVQGHVDGVGTVELASTGPEWRLRVRPPEPLMEYMAPKGSVALDGVSLTLAAVDPAGGWFEVALIPTTLELTTLAELKEGARCNLEADAMAKTVIHWLRHYGRGQA